jgi:hypothetical protein
MTTMNLERDEHNMGRLLNRLDHIIDLLKQRAEAEEDEPAARPAFTRDHDHSDELAASVHAYQKAVRKIILDSTTTMDHAMWREMAELNIDWPTVKKILVQEWLEEVDPDGLKLMADTLKSCGVHKIAAEMAEPEPATRTKVRLDSLAVGDLFRFEDETYEVDDAPPSVNGYIRVKASGAKLDPWYEIQKNEWVTPVEPENTGEKVVEGMTELRDMLRDEVERAMKAAHGQDAKALSRELDKVIAERESKRDPGDMTAACDKLREIIEPNQEQAEAERKAAAEEVAPGIADTEMVMLSRATFDRVVAHYERHDLAGCAGALRQAARPAKIDEEELREELAERGMDSSWHLHVCDCLRKMGWL